MAFDSLDGDSIKGDALGNVSSDDWPARASNTVVRYVGTVRDTTTGPALVASRYVVYLLAVSLIGIVLLLVLMAAFVRLLVVATGELPFVDEGEPWLAYYIMGAVFLLPGLVIWRKKEAKK